MDAYKGYCLRVGTFGTESAVRKRGGSRNLLYLNAKPRHIPLPVAYARTVTYKENRVRKWVYFVSQNKKTCAILGKNDKTYTERQNV